MQASSELRGYPSPRSSQNETNDRPSDSPRDNFADGENQHSHTIPVSFDERNVNKDELDVSSNNFNGDGKHDVTREVSLPGVMTNHNNGEMETQNDCDVIKKEGGDWAPSDFTSKNHENTNCVTHPNSCNHDTAKRDDGEIKFKSSGDESTLTADVKCGQADVFCMSNNGNNLNAPPSPSSLPNDIFHSDGNPSATSNFRVNCTPNSVVSAKISPTKSAKPLDKQLNHSLSDCMVSCKPLQEFNNNLDLRNLNRVGMRRSLSDMNICYSFTNCEACDTSDKSRETKVVSCNDRVMSEPNLLEEDEDVLRVDDVFSRKESSDDSDDDFFCRHADLHTFTGPTWTFAKRVEDSVRKILSVKNDISQVDKLISADLCTVLYEFISHGLKKNLFGISAFSLGSNVWVVCESVSKVSNVQFFKFKCSSYFMDLTLDNFPLVHSDLRCS